MMIRKCELRVKNCIILAHFEGNGMVALEEAKEAAILGFESPKQSLM